MSMYFVNPIEKNHIHTLISRQEFEKHRMRTCLVPPPFLLLQSLSQSFIESSYQSVKPTKIPGSTNKLFLTARELNR